jgi:hypothetical protein
MRAGRLRGASGRMMVIRVPAAGVYTLSLDPAGVFAGRLGSLRPRGS